MTVKDRTKLAIAVTISKNIKVGLMAATYASQFSCPKSCALLHHGCYGGVGHVGLVTHRLNGAAQDCQASPLMVAKAEAAAVDSMAVIPGVPMRGHVVGDCSTPTCAKVVASAYRGYMLRGGGQAYSYTHAWSKVPRSAWGQDLSVLASCEGLSQALEARKQGYLTAAVIMRDRPAKAVTMQGLKVIPCQFQSKGTQCVDCKLCLREDTLAKQGAVIAFGPDNKTSASVCQD